MPDPERRIDREASRAIRRVHDQLYADGKLDKADATEGAGILFAPIALAAVGLVGLVLTSLGLKGAGVVFVGVPLLLGLGALALYLGQKR